jgi:uncharacterized SAM-binding protein YcdF (DUF218 family)
MKSVDPKQHFTMQSTDSIPDISKDINLLATFLAHAEVPPQSLQTREPVDCIVICASSVLNQASNLFHALESRPSLTRTLVLVGGIGHSTSHIYDAVARHPQYNAIHAQISGLPEAQVLQAILDRFFSLSGIEAGGPRVLVEDQSTNCGANAVKTRQVLDEAGVSGIETCIVVQDPTMSLRTKVSFEKAFEDLPMLRRPHFLACPIVVPVVQAVDGRLEYVLDLAADLRAEDLWEMKRLCELLVGEITRLRDDENGYGPKGKGFIGHVDVPVEVEAAANRVRDILGVGR